MLACHATESRPLALTCDLGFTILLLPGELQGTPHVCSELQPSEGRQGCMKLTNDIWTKDW